MVVSASIVADPRDPEQRVVGRPLKGACVQQQFVIEIQKRRHALPLMRDHGIVDDSLPLEEMRAQNKLPGDLRDPRSFETDQAFSAYLREQMAEARPEDPSPNPDRSEM